MSLRSLLVALLTVEVMAAAFFIWQRHIVHGWETVNPAALFRSPDAHYLYSAALRAESGGLGFVLGFWAGSVIATVVAFRSAPGQAKFAEKVVASMVALAPALAIAISVACCTTI